MKITIKFSFLEILKMLWFSLFYPEWSMTITDYGWTSGTGDVKSEHYY